ncbi:MAG TPA: energy transducer TonB [Myxococcales bacterium]|nr:energy transducer TonB [Myxococcales bacterium]
MREPGAFGSKTPVSTWAQLALIAALFCLGRETLPSRFSEWLEEKAPEVVPQLVPRRSPPVAAQRAPEVASVVSPTAPSARPPRRLRARPSALRDLAPAVPRAPKALAEAEPEMPAYPVVSRVFFGLEGPGTLPTKISGPDPTYTTTALDHEIEGVMRVACIITISGEVDRCRVLHGVPYMDVAVKQALQQRHYEPGRLADGTPVETELVFVVKMLLQGSGDLLVVN